MPIRVSLFSTHQQMVTVAVVGIPGTANPCSGRYWLDCLKLRDSCSTEDLSRRQILRQSVGEFDLDVKDFRLPQVTQFP